jgi:hypothetical protein
MEDDDRRAVRQQVGDRTFEEAGEDKWEEASPRTRGTLFPRLRPAVS